MTKPPSSYEVFLSYNSADRVFATDMVEKLKSAGTRVWFDLEAVAPGQSFQDAIENAIRSVRTVVVLIGRSGLGAWEEMEVRAALIETVRRGLTIIPVLIPGAEREASVPLFLESFSMLDMREGLTDNAFHRLLTAVHGTAGSLALEGSVEESAPLVELVARARRWIVMSGFNLSQVWRDAHLREVLLRALHAGVRVTLLQLNPGCTHAQAYGSTGWADAEVLAALRTTFHTIPESSRTKLEVLFVNYAPQPPTVVCDQSVYVFLQRADDMDLQRPDLLLPDKGPLSAEPTRMRLHNATLAPLEGADVNPYIRYGQIYDYFASSKVSSWDQWRPEQRLRRTVTHDFYVRYANNFHARFGWNLEREVGAHLDLLSGSTLVLGCGSGKEVGHLARRQPDVTIDGLDSSPIAIDIARERYRGEPNQRYTVGDFYDLDRIYEGRFANVVANAAFVHLLRRDDLDEMLDRVHRRLQARGLFFLRGLYKESRDGTAPPDELDLGGADRWSAQRWFVYYSPTELAKRLRHHGFDVLRAETDKIAKSVLGAGSASVLRTVRTKGFPHATYAGVYWPTILARRV